MAKTDLTNQRQVFVEEYVRSGDQWGDWLIKGEWKRPLLASPHLSPERTYSSTKTYL